MSMCACRIINERRIGGGPCESAQGRGGGGRHRLWIPRWYGCQRGKWYIARPVTSNQFKVRIPSHPPHLVVQHPPPPTVGVSSTVHVPRPVISSTAADTSSPSHPHPLPSPRTIFKSKLWINRCTRRREGFISWTGNFYVTPEISTPIKRGTSAYTDGERYLWRNVTDGLYFRSRTATRALWQGTFVPVFAAVLREHVATHTPTHPHRHTCTTDRGSTYYGEFFTVTARLPGPRKKTQQVLTKNYL